VLRAKEHAPTFFPFVVFTFGLVVESIKELGGVLEVLRTRECTPTPSPFVVFTFGLTVESVKELGGSLINKYITCIFIFRKIFHY
jgi:hypothetical protein